MRIEQLNDLLLFDIEKMRSNYKSLSMCLDDRNLRQAKQAIINIRFAMVDIEGLTRELRKLIDDEIQTQQAQQAQQKKV
nr:MAG: hypothetical protein [Microvirus sp.]